jgi:hypothetical protein
MIYKEVIIGLVTLSFVTTCMSFVDNIIQVICVFNDQYMSDEHPTFKPWIFLVLTCESIIYLMLRSEKTWYFFINFLWCLRPIPGRDGFEPTTHHKISFDIYHQVHIQKHWFVNVLNFHSQLMYIYM